MPILIDTNILLRTCDYTHQHHAECAKLLDPQTRLADRIFVCAQVLIEYWAVATRPISTNGLGLSCEQPDANLRDFLSLVPCLPEPPDMALRWRKVVTRYAVAGKQAHDARLVALMEAHALNRILTFNAMDFARYSFVQSVSPAQLLAASTV